MNARDQQKLIKVFSALTEHQREKALAELRALVLANGVTARVMWITARGDRIPKLAPVANLRVQRAYGQPINWTLSSTAPVQRQRRDSMPAPGWRRKW